MMQTDALYQRQNQIGVVLEHHDRARGTEKVFQYLYDHTSTQFAYGIIEGEPLFPPQQGKQSQNIQWPFSQL